MLQKCNHRWIIDHIEVTKRLQEAVQRAVSTEEAPTLLGVQKLKSGDIRFKCEAEKAQRLHDIDWAHAYPGTKARRVRSCNPRSPN
jgi:hypothetical protein